MSGIGPCLLFRRLLNKLNGSKGKVFALSVGWIVLKGLHRQERCSNKTSQCQDYDMFLSSWLRSDFRVLVAVTYLGQCDYHLQTYAILRGQAHGERMH